MATPWIRQHLPAAYATVLDDALEAAHQDDNVRGVLLTGSLARCDALPGTDIDLRLILRHVDRPRFARRYRLDLLLEQSASTEHDATDTLIHQPMHVYAYLDGRVLLDHDGSLARLHETALSRFEGYRTPPARRAQLADDLQHPRSKIAVSLAAGDLYRAVYSLHTATWQIIDALWAANDRPTPPNGSVLPHLGDLHGPQDVHTTFRNMFVSDPRTRAETGLALIDWIIETLRREQPELS